MIVLRSIGAVVAGIVVTVAVMMMGETWLTVLYPLPPDLDPADPKSALILAKHIAEAPAWVGLLLVAVHALATFVGAASAAAMAERGKLQHALFIGCLFLLGGIANIKMIPHPAWLVAIWLPVYPLSAWFAGRLIPQLQARSRLANLLTQGRR